MASEIDICNLALARLGDAATVASIDPPEGSAQATHCAQFYPLARDTTIARHVWSFCTTRTGLSLLSATPESGWTYAFAPPSDAVEIIALYEAGAADDSNPLQFETETLADGTEVIYCNTDDVVCRYKYQETDPSKFPPLVVDALASLLASHLAGPVLKGDKGRKAALDWFQMYERVQLPLAISADARQRKVTPTHTPGWISAR